MELVSKRNFIILLAAVLVVGFGIMSLYLNNKKIRNLPANNTAQVTLQPTMSKSDKVNDIETDLNGTDVNSMDKDLQDLDKEINQIQ